MGITNPELDLPVALVRSRNLNRLRGGVDSDKPSWPTEVPILRRVEAVTAADIEDRPIGERDR